MLTWDGCTVGLCWIIVLPNLLAEQFKHSKLIIGEFTGSIPVVGCMGKNELNSGVSRLSLLGIIKM
jgi:hypothetical protein